MRAHHLAFVLVIPACTSSDMGDGGPDASMMDSGIADTSKADSSKMDASSDATDSSTMDSTSMDSSMSDSSADAVSDSSSDAPMDAAADGGSVWSSPTCDGTVSAMEYGGAQNQFKTKGNQTWSMTWDVTNLYVALENA